MRALVALAAVLTFGALAGAGCARVRPWERGSLAKLDRYAERCGKARAYDAHLWMVREGAVGGSGRPGGGCGCN